MHLLSLYSGPPSAKALTVVKYSLCIKNIVNQHLFRDKAGLDRSIRAPLIDPEALWKLPFHRQPVLRFRAARWRGTPPARMQFVYPKRLSAHGLWRERAVGTLFRRSQWARLESKECW